MKQRNSRNQPIIPPDLPEVLARHTSETSRSVYEGADSSHLAQGLSLRITPDLFFPPTGLARLRRGLRHLWALVKRQIRGRHG